MGEEAEYIVQCFNCLAEFDALEAVWCQHDPHSPTKICPYCLQCFCNAPQDYIQQFWVNAPEPIKTELAALRRAKHPLGHLMVLSGVISMEQMLAALADQHWSQQRLGEILVQKGIVSPEIRDFFLHIQNTQIPRPLKPEHVDTSVLKRLTPVFCYEHRVVPLTVHQVGEERFLILACARRAQPEVMQKIRQVTDAHPVPFLAEPEDVERALQPFLVRGEPTEGATLDPEKWWSDLIATALARGASDILFDPTPSELMVRVRIDGVLYKWQTLPVQYYLPILEQIRKFMKFDARGDELPDRGEIKLRMRDRDFKIQAIIFPTSLGANVAMKIVDMADYLRDVSALDLFPEQEVLVFKALKRKTGLVVVSGPPMHGTLITEYAFINELRKAQRRVVTVESPILFTLPGVQQIETDPVHGRDIRTTVAELPQYQPDVVLLASVPRPEVLKQLLELDIEPLAIVDLNAMSVWDAVQWLQKSGIKRDELARKLRLVTNQRLVRKICSECREPAADTAASLAPLGLPAEATEGVTLYTGKGCKSCNFLGYRGRIALYEVLYFDKELKQAVRERQPIHLLKVLAHKKGFISLKKACLHVIQQGQTTVEEMRRWNIQE